jgi:KTSC domain
MKTVAFEKSMLQSVTYDEEQQTLDVLFANGRKYRYFEVPEIVVAGLIRAESKGRFFNERIRDSFPSARA